MTTALADTMYGDVPICGDLLAPIPGECWVCVEPAGHGPDEHVAEDGTRW